MGNINTKVANDIAGMGMPFINHAKNRVIDRLCYLEKLKITVDVHDKTNLEQTILITENDIIQNLSRANMYMLSVRDQINRIGKNYKLAKAINFVDDYQELRTKIPFKTFTLLATANLLAQIDSRTQGV